jgi:hypothetical protein
MPPARGIETSARQPLTRDPPPIPREFLDPVEADRLLIGDMRLRDE